MTVSKRDQPGEDEEETYWLQDFKFNHKKVPHPTILLVGKRFSGKSYTSVSIAEKFEVPRWAAWCGTKDTEDFWAEKFESSASVKGPDEAGKAYLVKVIKYQQRKGRLYKRVLKQPFPRKYCIGLIFDDVTSKRQFRRGELLEDLFSNGRHYHSVIIISAQYLKQLPPAVRLNTDYLFMMHNTKRTIKVLYEDYVEEPDEFGMFLELIRSVTGQTDSKGKDMFNSLVYDNVVKTSRLDEMFKVYRNEGAEVIDKMLLGDPNWREFNRTHFKDKDYELQKREYRKRKRLLRLQEYRQKQLAKRAGMGYYGGAPNALDIDYYSDSDSEDEETHDSVTLTHRGGQTMKVNFLKNQVSSFGTAGTNTGTGYSIPSTSPIPAPAGDIYGHTSQPSAAPLHSQYTSNYPHQGYPAQSSNTQANNYGNQYGSQYGSQYAGQYGSQYASPYESPYENSYPNNNYGNQHTNNYGSRYDSPYESPYESPYGSQRTNNYGSQYDRYETPFASGNQRGPYDSTQFTATTPGLQSWSDQKAFLRANSRPVVTNRTFL